MNKELLGQFFTPNAIVEKMVALIQNNGKVLEPSCGDGAFYNSLKHLDIVGIEIDAEVACKGSLVMDFFDWTEKVDTIIGNPPYVKYQHISNDTLNKLPQVMDKRTNLYLFFTTFLSNKFNELNNIFCKFIIEYFRFFICFIMHIKHTNIVYEIIHECMLFQYFRAKVHTELTEYNNKSSDILHVYPIW